METTYKSAGEAYDAWTAGCEKDRGEAELSALQAHSNADICVEAREMFRRLQNHFQLFGFLTSATFDGFVARVLSPNVTSNKGSNS